MSRLSMIKTTAKAYIKRMGLSEIIVSGHYSTGEEITQLEEVEIELGTLSNYRLEKQHQYWVNNKP